MLSETLKGKKIILASNSPRRKQFLTDLQLPFEVKPSHADESYPASLTREAITDFIAKAKAAYFTDILPHELIITCDTIVWHEGKALGKPDNFEQAFDILQALSGKTHEVISSVCLKSAEKEIVFHAVTEVSFSVLSSEDISFYLHHYRPYDKAGAYGIQEWIGLIGIHSIKGSYTNVVGMPMEKLYHHLITFFD